MVMMEQETLLHTESGTPQTLFAATEVVGDQRYSLCRSVSLFEQQEAAITSHSQMALFGCLYPLQVGKTVAPTEQFLIDFLRIGLLTVTNTPIVLKVELPQKKRRDQSWMLAVFSIINESMFCLNGIAKSS